MKRDKPFKERFYLEPTGFLARAAAVISVLASAFLVVSSLGSQYSLNEALILVLLPVCACLMFALLVNYLGKKLVGLSSAAVLAAAVYFVLYSFKGIPADNSTLAAVVYSLYAVAVAIIYFMTAFHLVFHNKWLVLLSFALAAAHQLAYKIIPGFFSASFIEGMGNMAVLLMAISGMLVSLALKKTKPAAVVPVSAPPAAVPDSSPPAAVPTPVSEPLPQAGPEPVLMPAPPDPVQETEPVAETVDPTLDSQDTATDCVELSGDDTAALTAPNEPDAVHDAPKSPAQDPGEGSLFRAIANYFRGGLK